MFKFSKYLFLFISVAFFGFSAFNVSAQFSAHPDGVLDLLVESYTSNTVTLSWTAPGYNGYAVDHYDMRMSSSDIFPDLWNGLAQVTGLPIPGNTGTRDSFTVTGLTPNTIYYFAIKGVAINGSISQDFNTTYPITTSSSGGTQNISNLSFLPVLEFGNPISKLFSITIFDQGTSNTAASFSATSNTSGLVALPGGVSLSSGNYDVGINSAKYLSKKMTNVNLFSDTTITLPQMKAGDVNSDGIVNSLDWSLVSSNWFTSNASYDLNGDNFVNSLDWSIISNNWFLTGDF